jgi:hypothetical protein
MINVLDDCLDNAGLQLRNCAFAPMDGAGQSFDHGDCWSDSTVYNHAISHATAHTVPFNQCYMSKVATLPLAA